MDDEELYKAIKEYEEKNNLKEVREVNKILRKIRDICRSYEPIECCGCPLYNKLFSACILLIDPENWEI